ncbi:MAG: 5'/3'-nucleotidase SurE [Treponema sp.]|jgi:5'-nucleotidase|nr:5'/3'-nucleotidase SurE [Treponema sp.]
MRILLTNDDGISSPGINLLAKALREAGHRVIIVAPDKNRSGSSHSIIFLNEPVNLKEIEKDTWLCSGTPVDCVILALLGGIPELNITTPQENQLNLENAPDLILSGINAGANLGTDITYSGTAAAARQGSLFGIRSVALSLVDNDAGVYHWEPVISYITENLTEFMGFWSSGSFININFPNNGKKPAALVPTFPSIRYYNDRIERQKADDGWSCFAHAGKVGKAPAEGSDWAEVLKGNAAISVVKSEPVSREV